MKNKFLLTAVVLGSLYETASAVMPITSPIYLPEKGEFVNQLNFGYYKQKMNPKVINADIGHTYASKYVSVDGLYGLTNKVALNYNAQLNFNQKYTYVNKVMNTELYKKFSADVVKYSLGLTARLFECQYDKVDLFLKIGSSSLYELDSQMYADLALRYGLNFKYYNFALTAGLIHYFDYQNNYKDKVYDYIYIENTKYENTVYFKLENELIFDKFTVGLDLYYNLVGKEKYKYIDVGYYEFYNTLDSYNEYGFNVDANYALNNNMYLGAYLDMSKSTLDSDTSKRPQTYSFGLKLTSNF